MKRLTLNLTRYVPYHLKTYNWQYHKWTHY